MSEAYVCPQCGADQWVADYSVVVTQTVDKLVRLPDGSFDATYSEPAVIVEEGPTVDWRCSDCGHVEFTGFTDFTDRRRRLHREY